MDVCLKDFFSYIGELILFFLYFPSIKYYFMVHKGRHLRVRTDTTFYITEKHEYLSQDTPNVDN